MIPSVLATQLQSTLLDYLQTTFNLSDQKLESRLCNFLQGPEGPLKGSFIDVRLPFRGASADEEVPTHQPPETGPPAAPARGSGALVSQPAGHVPTARRTCSRHANTFVRPTL